MKFSSIVKSEPWKSVRKPEKSRYRRNVMSQKIISGFITAVRNAIIIFGLNITEEVGLERGQNIALVADRIFSGMRIWRKRRMSKIKLKPCPICGKSDIKIETWVSGSRMYMVKCNNTDCPVPYNGFPTGTNLDEVKAEWNRRADNE